MDELYTQLEQWIENHKYRYSMGEWFKGKSSKAITPEKMAELVPPMIKENYPLKDIKEQLAQVAITLEDEDEEDSDDQDLETYVNGFLSSYREMLLSKWSEVDETVYEGLKYTINNDAPLILAPTGNGNEYTMIGRTYQDVYTALAGLKVKDSNINRLKYIENCIIHEILSACFPSGRQRPEVLDPSKLSACVLDSMYTKKPLFDDNHILNGYCLVYVNGKPNALKYMEKSLETFLANSDNYIENVAPISNDPSVPTFRYVSLDFVEGDWSAYKKWFSDTFENPLIVAKTFMCHIAAFLDAGNRGKQAMWIRGYGDDAKSTVFNAISDYLGSAASPIDIKLLKDNAHGWTQFDNVRLGIVSDAKCPAAIGDPWFHKVTGNDTYLSNEKFKTPRKVTAITKLVFLENIDPIVKVNQDNQMSRIVYYKCKLKTVEDKVKAGIGIVDEAGVFHKTGNEEFAKAIREQTPAFLNACMKLYWSENTLCPTRSQVIVPAHMTDDLVTVCSDESEDLLEYELEKQIERGLPSDYIPRSELHDSIKSAYSANWHPIVSPQTIKLLLEKTYGSVVKNIRKDDGTRVRAYTGVKLKNALDGNSSYKLANNQPKTASDMVKEIKAKAISKTLELTPDDAWMKDGE